VRGGRCAHAQQRGKKEKKVLSRKKGENKKKIPGCEGADKRGKRETTLCLRAKKREE